MARRRSQKIDNAPVAFDVFYEDGSRASNRKVPAEVLGGLDGDEPAKDYFIEQDRKIAEMSGRAPKGIKSVVRSA